MLSSSLDGCDQHPARETMMRLLVLALLCLLRFPASQPQTLQQRAAGW